MPDKEVFMRETTKDIGYAAEDRTRDLEALMTTISGGLMSAMCQDVVDNEGRDLRRPLEEVANEAVTRWRSWRAFPTRPRGFPAS